MVHHDPNHPPTLSLTNVHKRFGAVNALESVDLEVHPGEVLSLVGDNGAGKSTIVKILSGVHRADEGEIYFQGKRVQIGTPDDAINLGIATVFQDLALCDNLTVYENLFLGRELSPLRLDTIQMEVQSWDLLRELSAKIPSVHVKVSALSGGQRQTVAVARSLLGDPKLIILDEPTAALGVEQTEEVLSLIGRLKERGLAVIFVSHNMQNVLDVSDRIAVLRLGKNNGVFNASDVDINQLVASITGSNQAMNGNPAAGVGARDHSDSADTDVDGTDNA